MLDGIFERVLARAHLVFPWISSVKLRYCAAADKDHEKSWRQFAHTGCRDGEVCFARAANDDLTADEMTGMVAHELGHVVGDTLRFPEHARAKRSAGKTPQAVQDEADRIAKEFFGIEIRYNRRTLQEASLDGALRNPDGRSYREIFEEELATHGITWCQGCDIYASHSRGYAIKADRTIHLSSEIATRRTLHRGLHEIGHIVNDETGMRRFEKEEAANVFAERRMRELGIAVPRSEAAKGRQYVSRMKRWGDSIKRSR